MLPIILIALAVIAGLLIGGAILLGVSKLFGIQNPSYKKSLVILVASWLASTVVGVIFAIIDLGAISNALVTLASFYAFYYLFHRYYASTWAKTLGVYIAFSVAGVLAAIILVLPLRLFALEPFTIVGDAMSPTYESGDYLLVNKLVRSYERGDTVLYSRSNEPGKVFVRRIVGLPGEKIEVRDGKIHANGARLPEEEYIAGTTAINASVNLAEDEYIVLGDNRGLEPELKSLEPIHRSNIIGKVFFKLPTRKAAPDISLLDYVEHQFDPTINPDTGSHEELRKLEKSKKTFHGDAKVLADSDSMKYVELTREDEEKGVLQKFTAGSDTYELKGGLLTGYGVYKNDTQLFRRNMEYGANGPILDWRIVEGKPAFTVRLSCEENSCTHDVFYGGEFLGEKYKIYNIQDPRYLFAYNEKIGFVAKDSGQQDVIFYNGKIITGPFDTIHTHNCCSIMQILPTVYENGILLFYGTRSDKGYLVEVRLDSYYADKNPEQSDAIIDDVKSD
ncbi:MAG: signal peptidase I [bacterium]|nr:signal peptidase I [bacterium]